MLLFLFQALEALRDGEIQCVETAEGKLYQIKSVSWTDGRTISVGQSWTGRTCYVVSCVVVI